MRKFLIVLFVMLLLAACDESTPAPTSSAPAVEIEANIKHDCLDYAVFLDVVFCESYGNRVEINADSDFVVTVNGHVFLVSRDNKASFKRYPIDEVTIISNEHECEIPLIEKDQGEVFITILCEE